MVAYIALSGTHCAACGARVSRILSCQHCDLRLCAACAETSHPCEWFRWQKARRLEVAAAADGPSVDQLELPYAL